MKFFFCLFTFSLFFKPDHALYISVTDIFYLENQKELEIKFKIFSNDLEDDIRTSQNKVLELEDGVDEEEAAVVHKYLLEKVEIFVDGKAAPVNMISCKQEGDAVFSIYKGTLESAPKKLEIYNKILIDLFPTQRNIIRLRGKSPLGLLKLDKQTIKGELSF
ncbi:MAG: DUF6702 family protein [Bacteroidota bacterium]